MTSFLGDDAEFHPLSNTGIPVPWNGVDDTAAMNTAFAAAALLGVSAVMELRTYIYKPTQNLIGAGGATRYYGLNLLSNLHVVGIPGTPEHPGTKIKLADNQSTDLAPKDTNAFASNGVTYNIYFYGIEFDQNGQNNLISPNRATHVYNQFCCGAVNITGDTAWVDGLTFEKCGFINCAGTNQVVTGQSANGVAGPLSQNVRMIDCYARNNGLDVDDHSTVYFWAENYWMERCDFKQDLTTLTLTDRNWVPWEKHGKNGWITNSTFRGFFRGGWLSANFTSETFGLWVLDNEFEVISQGPSFFREIASFLSLSKAFIARNKIVVLDTVSPTTQKAGVQIAVAFDVSDIYIDANDITGLGVGYDSVAFQINARPSPGGGVATVSRVFATGNRVSRLVSGMYCRNNLGDGVCDEIHDWDNFYYDLGKTFPAGESTGSRYQDGTVAGMGKVSSLRNRNVAPAGSVDFDRGVFLIGTIAEAYVDNNVYDGMQIYPGGSPYSLENAATIDRRLGVQLCSGSAAPVTGTWKPGERWSNFAATVRANIGYWEFDASSVWRAFGIGFGTTAQRPALTINDSGYGYKDTTLNTFVVWDGTVFV